MSEFIKKEEEIKIAIKIKKKYNCHIILKDIPPYSLYCAADIGKILNLHNIRAKISKYSTNYKILLKVNTNRGKQGMSFLTFIGLLKVISKSRKPEVLNFANEIGMYVNYVVFTCIEVDTIKCIMETFKREKMETQYVVLTYKIDLYFIDYNLAIECNEDRHNLKRYLKNNEIREDKIKNALNCVFIKYNPYEKNFNIFKLINQIYAYIMNEKTFNKIHFNFFLY